MAAKVILLILRAGVAGVFLYAGIPKAWDTQEFAIAVHNYELTPMALSVATAFYLPWLEIFAAIGLWISRVYLGALTILSGLTLVFLGAIGSAWWRGLDITCGCFGRDENATNFPLHIGGNLVLLTALAALIAAEVRRTRTTPAAPAGGSVAAV